MTNSKETGAGSGRLIYAHSWNRQLGVNGPSEHRSCADCGTSFPVIDGATRCNGHTIDRCPWCRSDSAAWQRGRGL